MPDIKDIDKNMSPANSAPIADSPSAEAAAAQAAVSDQPKPVIEIAVAEELMAGDKKALTQKISESEFVSDEFQTSNDTDLAEIKDGMRKLGIDSMTQQALAASDGKRS